MRPLKIISGGQTGVDRAALDVAIELGIPHGGWCPRGRKAEDGRIHDRYLLTEAPDAFYAQRTRLNIQEASWTMILTRPGDPPTPGTAATKRICQGMGSKWHGAWADPLHEIQLHRLWLAGHRQKGNGDFVLNIAGPRESKCPGIYDAAKAFLLEVLR